MKRHHEALFAAVLALGCGSALGTNGDFSDWDADGDGRVTEDEFDEGVLDQYYGVTGLDENMMVATPDAWGDVELDLGDGRQTWDLDADGSLNLREYVDARYDDIDADDDGTITNREWAEAREDGRLDW